MLSEEEIIDELINIEMKFSDIEILEDLNNQLIQMSRDEMLSAIKSLRNLLNNTDLINQKKISAMDLIYKRYPNKQVKVKSKDISTKDLYLNDTAEDFKYKNDRLIKKRKLAEQLENEYKFERNFNPDIDESEFLYSQYTDEEEYLDAKIEELQKKNLAYDCYLTPEEENIYREDFQVNKKT